MKDEQSLEIEKNQEELNMTINDMKDKFKHYNIRDDKEIQILEEKFRYDIFNCIGNMFNLKNKK